MAFRSISKKALQISLQLLGLGMLLLNIYLMIWSDISFSKLVPLFVTGLLLCVILPSALSRPDKEQ